MKCAVVAALLLAGCGRSHFDLCGPTADANAATPDGPSGTANVAFVTSSKHTATGFGADPIAGADAICATRARGRLARRVHRVAVDIDATFEPIMTGTGANGVAGLNCSDFTNSTDSICLEE